MRYPGRLKPRAARSHNAWGPRRSRGVRRRKVDDGSGAGMAKSKGKHKRGAHIGELHGWEWDEKEDFIIERCVPI